MAQANKLIEVALPVKEISTESVRDKYIHHGHISTVHIWWARRPLPMCRATVFASLVPDPLDENCPKAFKEAVDLILGPENNSGDPYKPYEDIPYTAAIDPMKDNLRNRLMMFIGKFSEKFIENEKQGNNTPNKKRLSDYCLIKWENRDKQNIIQKARKLIWVAYNSERNPNKNAELLLNEFQGYWDNIKKAEKTLFEHPDRHLGSSEVNEKQNNLEDAIEEFQKRMPKVFDPFAGGGAIPLEASRLGCRSYGNDLNPVAHVIQKASLEFPQKFAKPINFSKESFIKKYGKDELRKLEDNNNLFKNNGDYISVKNRLRFDVEFYAHKLLARVEDKIGEYYSDKTSSDTIAYYWARVGKCQNPSCNASVPLLRQFYLSKKKGKNIHLNPLISGTEINFEIKNGKTDEDRWNYRGNLRCPCCGNTTPKEEIKKQSKQGGLPERLLAVVVDGENGKDYRLPTESEKEALEKLSNLKDVDVPQESMHRNSAGGDTFGWGINKWGQLFNTRQLLALNTFSEELNEIGEEIKSDNEEYRKAIITYLSIWIDRYASYNTSFGRWIPQNEQLASIFARQAIPMVFDYPEVNPFSNQTGSPLNQLDWILRYLDSESNYPFTSICKNAASGDVTQFDTKSLDAVVTDPPYYDAIAYADLSDFFYLWLKRMITDLYPNNFATPQTPKSEECTALKHHHNDDSNEAKKHFESKLREIFNVIEQQTDGPVSIMFAHQSTEAWSTLCNSILGADMNISGSWAIDSERDTRMLAVNTAALQSSVTVSCKPSKAKGIGDYQEIKDNILTTIKKEVDILYKLGFRGADLLTACFGQAVKEFGKFKRVEKADGSIVTVEELLKMAREAAFNAIISDIEADDFTRFYIGWLNLFGFTQADHDDVRRITQIGLNLNVDELIDKTILVRNGDSQTLADSTQRIKNDKNLGKKESASIIDKVHRTIILFRNPNRDKLIAYLGQHASNQHAPFWRVVNALAEVLPPETEDHDSVTGLITNKENLLKEAQQTDQKEGEQQDIFNEE